MSTTTITTPATDAQPPCPECAVALHPVGLGRHRYWSCRWCGVTMRRA
jgi:tRNA(Ile2) C34 agmatinyltransferase TiaS